jgi:hypothetical protein
VPEYPAAAPTIEPPPASGWQDAATAFGLLSSTVRLHVLWEFARDVGTLAAATGHSIRAVSQHLGKLKLAGMFCARRQGKHSVDVLTDTQVTAIVGLVIARAAVPPPARAHPRRTQPATRMSTPQPIPV